MHLAGLPAFCGIFVWITRSGKLCLRMLPQKKQSCTHIDVAAPRKFAALIPFYPDEKDDNDGRGTY